MPNRGSILLVDDHPVNLIILEELLADEYGTVSVGSGEEAIRLLPELKPGLVLLDVMMPGVDGFEVCRWIRNQPDLESSRIILISASVRPADIEEGLTAGADEYIGKPFQLSALKETIRKYF